MLLRRIRHIDRNRDIGVLSELEKFAPSGSGQLLLTLFESVE
jgi:hypothetical protein